MDQFEEETFEHHRRVENIIRYFEDEETKLEEAKKNIVSTEGFGPAFDILRLFYLLDQQQPNDDEERRKLPEDFRERLQTNAEPIIAEEEIQDDKQTKETMPPTQSEEVQLNQPSVVLPTQPPPPTPPPPPKQEQPKPTATARPNPSIGDATLAKRQEITRQAEIYETRYRTVDKTRQQLLTAVVKSILNKLRKETYTSLRNDLIGFLQGQEQVLGTQKIKILTDEERLYALTRSAVLILGQLLGGDLTDVKNEIFLPLVTDIGSNPKTPEFSTIFLHQLYKRCPYTIPSYPERTPTMTDEQYKENLGYIKKKEGDQTRFETESEFLNRMNGLIRLFCKLLISGGPPFDANLAVAWRWIVDIINLPPRPQITAILLRVFLDEAGQKMRQTYGIQFVKILELVETKYLTFLEKETSADQMSRLKMTLQQLNSVR